MTDESSCLTMKDSKVRWIGECPSDWEIVQLKWKGGIKRGASPRPIEDPKYFDDFGEYAWVRISDVTASNKYLQKTQQKLSKLGAELSVKLEPNSLFLSIAGSVGKCCITRIKACIHDGFVYFPSFKGEPQWLYYVFESKGLFDGLGKLGTQLNLNTDTVGSIYLPFPSLNVQRQIAAYLNRENAKIDKLISEQKKLIKLLHEKRLAVISRAVTKGLAPDVKMRHSGVDWLGEVPRHWGVLQLKWKTQVKRGASPRPIDDPRYFDDEGEYAWVRISDVTSSGVYLEKTTQRLSDLGRSFSVPLQPGSLFLSIAGSVGKPCIAGLKCCIHDGFVHFPNIRGYEKWLYYIFETKLPFGGLGKMGTQLNLNTDTVGSIYYPFPPVEEARAIVYKLEEKLATLDELVSKARHSIDLLQEHRQILITAAVTGKIDVRGLVTDEEVAALDADPVLETTEEDFESEVAEADYITEEE